jgi:leucyl-tRNA synthetase
VLLSLGVDALGLPAEQGALRDGISPREWVGRCSERIRGRLETLGCSCDWERMVISSEPAYYHRTQRLFLASSSGSSARPAVRYRAR